MQEKQYCTRIDESVGEASMDELVTFGVLMANEPDGLQLDVTNVPDVVFCPTQDTPHGKVEVTPLMKKLTHLAFGVVAVLRWCTEAKSHYAICVSPNLSRAVKEAILFELGVSVSVEAMRWEH